MSRPSWRKAAGIFLIIALIVLWAVLVVMLVERIAGLPTLARMALYLVAGVAWVIPLGPLLRWMESGHFRR